MSPINSVFALTAVSFAAFSDLSGGTIENRMILKMLPAAILCCFLDHSGLSPGTALLLTGLSLLLLMFWRLRLLGGGDVKLFWLIFLFLPGDPGILLFVFTFMLALPAVLFGFVRYRRSRIRLGPAMLLALLTELSFYKFMVQP